MPTWRESNQGQFVDRRTLVGLRIYFAGPLFSLAEKEFNESVTRSLESRGADVYLPQRDGGLIVDLVARGVEPRAAARSIFERDVLALRECDAVVVILDGRSVDEGAALELGIAFAYGKLCVGLQTDPRRLLPLGNNPMIDGALDAAFEDVHHLIEYFEQTVSAAKFDIERSGAQ